MLFTCVDVKYDFVKDQVSGGAFTIQKVPTEDNPTDMGTNVVTTANFKHCLGLLHVEIG